MNWACDDCGHIHDGNPRHCSECGHTVLTPMMDDTEGGGGGRSWLHRLLGVLIVVAVIGGLLYYVGAPEAVAPPEPAEEMNRVQVEYLIHEKVNAERADHGLTPVEFDTELRAIGRSYSHTMAAGEFFSHYEPNGDSFEDRYAEADYDCEVQINETHSFKGGENLALTYYDQPVDTTLHETTEYETLDALAEGVVVGWMNSPDHRANILTGAWGNEGIGVHVTDDNAVYVTQTFC